MGSGCGTYDLGLRVAESMTSGALRVAEPMTSGALRVAEPMTSGALRVAEPMTSGALGLGRLGVTWALADWGTVSGGGRACRGSVP